MRSPVDKVGVIILQTGADYYRSHPELCVGAMAQLNNAERKVLGGFAGLILDARRHYDGNIEDAVDFGQAELSRRPLPGETVVDAAVSALQGEALPPTGLLLLRDAAAYLGVHIDTLRRRIADGRLPEAEMVATQHGDAYAIPGVLLVDVARREGWKIARLDVNQGAGGSSQGIGSRSTQLQGSSGFLEIAINALNRAAEANALAASNAADIERLRNEMGSVRSHVSSLRGDISALRSVGPR